MQGLAFLRSLDPGIAWKYLPYLLEGLWTNILLTALGFLGGGVVLGTLLALAMLSRSRVIAWPATAFVEFWRSTPLLVQAIWMHFAFPSATGISTTPFRSALLALTFNVSAYCSEIVRAGIKGVPRSQIEAGRALGMGRVAIACTIIAPQALRLVVPPLIGTVLSIFKATAILSVLAVNDLLRTASRLSSYTFRPVELYTTAALLALAVGLAITGAGHALEHRLKRGWA